MHTQRPEHFFPGYSSVQNIINISVTAYYLRRSLRDLKCDLVHASCYCCHDVYSIPLLNAKKNKQKHISSGVLRCCLFLHSTNCGSTGAQRKIKTHLFCGQQAKDRTCFVSPTCVNLTVWSLPFVGDGRWPKRTLSFAGCPHNKFSFSSGECYCSTLCLHPPAAVHLCPLSRAELRSLLLLLSV